MKSLKISLTIILPVLLLCSCSHDKVFSSGQWKITLNTDNTFTLQKKDHFTLSSIGTTYRFADQVVYISDYKLHSTEETTEAGKDIITFVYTSPVYPELIRKFYITPDADYIETDFTLRSKDTISSNYMAPAVIENNEIFGGTSDSRALFIPFDNDKWVRFQSHVLDFQQLTSYEATAVFDNKSRRGMVVGSVEHDAWKTGIGMNAGNNRLTSLVCYGGASDELTRDSRPHGAIKGKEIKSPRVFIGYFDDWRTGMETYADANAAIAPPKAWEKDVPFGWNSWGVLQFRLNFEKAMQVSDFFKNNLQNNHFKNRDYEVYIGLDSGWNSFSEEQLKAFVEKCKANGQQAGIYWTPFTDWGKDPERTIQDAPAYRYKDVYLYANGKPQDLDGAYATDPTHPAIEMQMQKVSELFRRCGFTYVKMDFMTHGALEADHWYDPKIQTGIQAYNYGMKLLDRYFGDMFINLSISPVFPAHYAQSRRIACDAWNKIKDTEYTLNALSYGWWIDRVYQFNDADHVVLQEAGEGENRARITSAVITGLFITGDDFSEGGSGEGKAKARAFLTNPDINAVARGVSFRPLEGNGGKSENQFVHTDESGNVYYAVFNYTESPFMLKIPFSRIGINPMEIKNVRELWSGKPVDPDGTLKVNPKDVILVKFEK